MTYGSGVVRADIIEDDPLIARQIKEWLEPYGFKVTLYESAEAFLEKNSQNNSPDLIIVDWMLPGISGLDLVKHLKGQKSTCPYCPIIFCSSMANSNDIALALYSGADDFITKPLNKTLLLARLFTVLRRYRNFIEHNGIGSDSVSVENVNGVAHMSRAGLAQLSDKEYRVYQILSQTKGQIVSREVLIQTLWPDYDHEELGYRPLDIVMSRLRKRIKTMPHVTKAILTHYGKGYSLEE